MRAKFAVCIAVFTLLVVPLSLAATGTIRIVISGGDLAAPIEIEDSNVVSFFQPMAGIGNFIAAPTGKQPYYPPQCFIVDWELGPTSAPKLSNVYEVQFVTTRPDKNTYTVRYVINSVTTHGYVLIPGKDDPAFPGNTMIYRGVEGHWFHAWDEWEKVAHPLIARAPKKP